MPVPVWEDKYLLGVDQIDRQHFHLFSTTRNLYNALLDGSDHELSASKRRALEYLDEYVRSHFLEEERFMEEIGFPELPSHRKLHEQFTLQVKGYQEKIESGSLLLTSSLLITMLEWFSDHLLLEDMKYVAFYREGKSASRR